MSIYDFGRTPEGVFYYAMEYLDGIDLQRLVDGDGAQPPERVAHILRQVLGALGATTVVNISAEATLFPSTVATVSNFQILRLSDR